MVRQMQTQEVNFSKIFHVKLNTWEPWQVIRVKMDVKIFIFLIIFKNEETAFEDEQSYLGEKFCIRNL